MIEAYSSGNGGVVDAESAQLKVATARVRWRRRETWKERQMNQDNRGGQNPADERLYLKKVSSQR